MESKSLDRIQSIDALRGVVMVIMLLDHVRETFYLHMQVDDPVDVLVTEPALFFARLLSSVCAPVFVLLTGLGAYLYGQKHSRAETSMFLLKRGLFLVVLELTIINFSWTGTFPPDTIFLQVIWVIGLSMITLSALLYLPRWTQFLLAGTIIAGHHLLASIQFAPGTIGYIPWAILYDRSWIEFGDILRMRTSYPLLPWIGVITLGYAIGPWFSTTKERAKRMRILLLAAAGFLAAFVILRWLNLYGDVARLTDQTVFIELMSFLSLTKYPPSLLFNLSTLGVGFLLLAWFEKIGESRPLSTIAIFGAAPMFFYIFHLYALKLIYLVCTLIFGSNQGEYFGFSTIGPLWLVFLSLAVLFYYPTAWISRLKRRRRDIGWLKYF